mgnify:CR=1 FL=1
MNALRHQAKLSNSEMLELSNLVTEIWKPIEGYEGIYEVSNKGRVRNSDGKVLKHCYDKDGYPRLSLRHNGKAHTLTIHRLVAKAFCFNPCPEKYTHVNHIDEVKTDNFYLNLEWCDNAYNHAYGTCGKRAGEKNSIPVIGEVIETGEKEYYKSMTEAAEKLSGDNSHICDCVNGKRKSAYGRKWYCCESAGFCTEHSAKSRGIGYEEEKSPTLRAGVVPAAIAIDNHPADSRVSISSDGNVQTLTSRCGTGGGNVPMLLEYPKAYGICSKHSNSMLSDNPGSGFYEADTARTIDTSNQSPCKNQGGIVVIEGNGSRPSHHGDGFKESETMYTLNCTENHAVSCGIGRPAMNQGYNARFSFQIEEETSPTLVASGAGGVAHPTYCASKASFFTRADEEKTGALVATDYKDPPLINDSTDGVEYIVRRLTPQECALLQGMPTWWCEDIGIENPTEEDMDFWRDVFETHRLAVSPEKKPKTDKQILKWLKNPHSDSAEYRMWGNGLAACNAFFVLAGIAHYAKQ